MPEDNRLEADPTQRVSQWLAELPDAPATPSKRNIVARLASAIQSARSKGYTLKAIALHLRDRGFDINYNTLRDALPRQKKSRPGKKKPRAAATDGARTNRDGMRTSHDGTRLSVVAPSGAHRAGPAVTSRGAAATHRAPDEPTPLAFPPGASCMFTGDGQFVPAPDSDDL